MIIKFVYKTV